MFTDFSSCSLLPIPSDESSSCAVVFGSDGKWKTSSFYIDSTGRAAISLPLELKFSSQKELEEYLDRDCFEPRPSNRSTEINEKVDVGDGDDTNAAFVAARSSSIGVQAKVALTFGTGEAILATVETVKILSSKIRGETSMAFETEIVVRVSAGAKSIAPEVASSVKANLDVSAVLSEKLPELDRTEAAMATLSNLSLAGLTIPSIKGPNRRLRVSRTSSFTLQIGLRYALSVAAKSVPGPFMGQTFLPLTVRHSGTHNEPITITRIALHPSHSREVNNANQSDLFDTSKLVQWGYAPRSDPKLPLTLNCNEAFSTVLSVDASQDTHCRTFSCPVSVTATLGRKGESHRYEVMGDVDTEWTTSKATTEPSDAFRVDLSLGGEETVCRVGAPMTVKVKVRNLGVEKRDLMLVVKNNSEDEEDTDSVKETESLTDEQKNEGGGLDLRGLSVSDKDTPNDLISLDGAYMLGAIDGQSVAHAVLRFIPLREGSVHIPRLQIVDRTNGRKYYCYHKLRATVESTE